MSTMAVTNIGAIVSGDINKPLMEGDTILIVDGKIRQIGGKSILEGVMAGQVVDARGTTVIPGLIDSHTHPVLGDFTPRQKTLDYLDSSVHGGVTTMISAGEPHVPGRPKDPAGTKALAVLVHKCFKNYRPTGLKVHGGALILEKGLEEKDFAELAEAGVWLVGEVGLGGVKTPEEAAPMVEWAKKYGMKVAMHTGGTSIPGSSTVTADMVLKINPSVVSHINGGTTAIPTGEVERLIEESDLPLEIVQCGNPRVADFTARRLKEKGQLHRIILGNDSPSGSGIIPLGILRTIVQLCSLSGIPAEKAIAMATGNTARAFNLNTSVIEPGREADLVIIDAPLGSVGSDALAAIEAGDIPGVSMVIIDGIIRVKVSRNTPPSKRQAEIK
ncbi:MAG: Enamidase [Peptococcaceae bacterium BRH_c4a]|nr:MAG: Enamidase [Peptococcaceae bacterium BRH_c4a]